MDDSKILWGVWVPGSGWLKAKGKAVAFEFEVVAVSTASRVGGLARVEYIDNSLADLEKTLLEAEEAGILREKVEKESKWFTKLLNFLKGEENGVS